MAPSVILAAGGTGGHIFPAASLAEALARRQLRVCLVTDDRGGSFEFADGTIEVRKIRAASPSRGGKLGRLKAIGELGIGTLQALAHLKRLDAAIAVGFGGYPSVPTVRAAALLGLPTVLHEQNAVLGRANRFLAPHASCIATSFREMVGLPAEIAARTRFTGNPVRGNVLALRATAYRPIDRSGEIRLLVFGGSQGASVFARVVPEALVSLPRELASRLRVVQQCRADDVESVKARYAANGIAAEILPFFSDLPERMAAAHLVIARSGASTVAELTTIGRPAILVPYPSAADDHQTANARAFEANGAGWLMPEDAFHPESLAARIECLFNIPDRLTEMAEQARAAGTPDAAERLADLVLEMAPGVFAASRGRTASPDRGDSGSAVNLRSVA